MDAFINAHMPHLEDFWRRTESSAEHTLRYQAFGLPVEVKANRPYLLEAARLSSNRYSRAILPENAAHLQLALIQDPLLPDTPVPHDLPRHLRYMAVGPYMMVNGEPWLNAVADLDTFRATALVSSSLAHSPHLLSRYVCDTFTLNMAMRTGLGMLHASCLYRPDCTLLLSAPHNTGKSTTALRLALRGWSLVADGMTYVRLRDDGIELLGYPVGEAKLRLDTVPWFAEHIKLGQATVVREEAKLVYDLRKELPQIVRTEAVRPQRLVLCYLERWDQATSRLEAAPWQTLLPDMWPESSFVDDPSVMRSNLAAVQEALQKARCYRLYLGSDVEDIVRCLENVCQA